MANTLDLNEVLIASESHPVPTVIGGAASYVHVGCSDKPKVTITRVALGYVAYCHKCGEGGFWPGGRFGIISQETASSPPVTTPRDLVGPRIAATVPGLSDKGMAWLSSYGISTHGLTSVMIRYLPHDPESQDFVMSSPIDGHIWIQTRRFDGARSKWATIRNQGDDRHIVIPRPQADAQTLVLTEDVISAAIADIRLTPYFHRLEVASMSGLSLSWESAAWAWTKYERVLLLVDNDTAGYSGGVKLANDILVPLFGEGQVALLPWGKPSPKDAGPSQWPELVDCIKGMGWT